VPDIRNIRPDLPPELSHVLRTALSRDPDERYQNAAAFAADLRELLGGASPDDVEPIFRALVSQTVNEEGFTSTAGQLFDLSRALDGIAIPLGHPVGARETEEPAATLPPEVVPTPRRSLRGLLIALVVALVAIAGGVAGYSFLGSGRDGGKARRPVALIIDQQRPDAAAQDPATLDASGPAPASGDAADAGPAPADADQRGLPPPGDVALLVDGDRPVQVQPLQPLTGRVVTNTLMQQQARLLQCVRVHQATSPDARIEAIRVVINRDGSVASASVEPAGAGSTPLGQCIADIARRTRFPRHPDASAAFRVPARLGGG